MTFKTAKYITGGILFAAMALSILGVLVLEKGSTAYALVFIAIIVLIAVALAVAAIWCRCPNCGTRLVSKLFKLDKCPKCGFSLSNDGKFKK